MDYENHREIRFSEVRRRVLVGGIALGASLLLPTTARAGRLTAAAGEVRINGLRARRGAAVEPGDIVNTGGLSQAVFVIGGDAFMLRADSEMEIYGSSRVRAGVVSGLRMLTGALLSVFAPGPKDILTATATAGIRGTGVYIEASPELTYFCTCYGEVDLADQHRQHKMHVIASYHQPHMIYGSMRDGHLMEPSAFKNHSDEELVFLESLVGRKPPFERG